MSGTMAKYLKNMQQGVKNTQSTKVDKNLVQAKGKTLDNLMNQIGADDDDDDDGKNSYNNRNNNGFNSNNKNYKIDFNYDSTQDYVPEYSKIKISQTKF